MKLYNVFKLLYTQTHNAHCFVEVFLFLSPICKQMKNYKLNIFNPKQDLKNCFQLKL